MFRLAACLSVIFSCFIASASAQHPPRVPDVRAPNLVKPPQNFDMRPSAPLKDVQPPTGVQAPPASAQPSCTANYDTCVAACNQRCGSRGFRSCWVSSTNCNLCDYECN